MANTALTYQSSFGITFTVVPQVGVAWTGITFPQVFGDIPFGWTCAISSITKSGATITVTPATTFQSLKLRILASQGDRLQIFPLSYVNLAPSPDRVIVSVPFDYNNLVQFDSTNTPLEVLVTTFLAGFTTKSAVVQISQFLAVAFFKDGSYTSADGAQPFSSIYGASGTFTDTGNLMLVKTIPR